MYIGLTVLGAAVIGLVSYLLLMQIGREDRLVNKLFSTFKHRI